MKSQRHIDPQALERLRTLGGKELVSKMVELFTSYAESVLQEAAAGLEAGNLEAVHRAAHSLKSSAGNLGALQVQDLAGRVEQLTKKGTQGVTTEMRQLMARLQEAYHSARDRLAKETEERP
jgi:HPt (histidine-containing phosphotransfer) domain-containing protein